MKKFPWKALMIGSTVMMVLVVVEMVMVLLVVVLAMERVE